jgi:hypothetical protein
MARSFREYLQPELPGADETEKSNSVFAKEPAWLVWFTHADIHAQILGLNVQHLSSKSRLNVRVFVCIYQKAHWGAPVARRRRRRILCHDARAIGPDNLTPRELKRALRMKISGGGGMPVLHTDGPADWP